MKYCLPGIISCPRREKSCLHGTKSCQIVWEIAFGEKEIVFREGENLTRKRKIVFRKPFAEDSEEKIVFRKYLAVVRRGDNLFGEGNLVHK